MKLRYKITGGIFAILMIGVLALGLVLSYTAPCGPAPESSDASETMQAFVYRCYGTPDVLEFAEVSKPVPEDNEVLVRIRAASVNPLDWHYLQGSPYFMRLGSGIGAPEDTRIGVDFAGVVEAVGSAVQHFQPGDEVFGGRTGAFGEFLVIAEDRAIVGKPADVTFEQAASLPIAAVTALQALRDKGDVKAGDKVLINGASGGVGTFAVQIAKVLGAEVHGVCSTRNVDMVRSLGADRVFDYKQESYIDSDETYDVIVDMVGNHSLSANRRVMAPDGVLVIVGGPSGNWIGPLIRPIGSVLLSPFVDQRFELLLAKFSQDNLEELAALVGAGDITPVIGHRYSLQELPEAIRFSEEGHARGKIVISID